MTKSIILNSVKKVFLDPKGVEDYYVFWTVNNNRLLLESVVTAFKSTTYSVFTLDHFEMDDLSFVVRQPDKLINLLNISDEEINLSIERKYDHRLIIKDTSFEHDFILCDPNDIPVVIPNMEEPEVYDLEQEIDVNFIDRFLKIKKANGSERVTIYVKDKQLIFELGDNNSYSNKSRFTIDKQEDDNLFDIPKLSFSSDILKVLLDRNKGCAGRMYLCAEGLIKIVFTEVQETVNTKMVYYLVALDEL